MSCSKGRYHVENQGFDLGLISRIPITPSKIRVNLTVYDYMANEKEVLEKRPLVCLEVHVVITPSRSNRHTTNAPLVLPTKSHQ